MNFLQYVFDIFFSLNGCKEDHQDPILTLIGSGSVSLTRGNDYYEEGIKAKDIIFEQIVLDHETGENTKKIIFTASDELRFRMELSFASMNLGSYLIKKTTDEIKGRSFMTESEISTSSANKDVEPLEINVYVGDETFKEDINEVGSYQIKYEVKDKDDNTFRVARIINVTD